MKAPSKAPLAWVAGLAIGIMAAACGEEAAPAATEAPVSAGTSKAQGTKPKVVAAVTDAGVVEEVAAYVYVYNPVGKRDPFRSLVEDIKQVESKDPQAPVCTEPLCRFDIDQMGLVGVVSGDANPMAMIETSDGVGHVVRRNSKVGRQGGRVTEIQRDCVVVTEYFSTPDGKVNPNRINLCVKQDAKAVDVVDLMTNRRIE